MYQFMDSCLACSWEALAIEGVECKTLYENQELGQKTVLTKLAPGATIPMHWHTNADETVYVIEGILLEEGTEYGAGSYFVGKAKTTHGPHHSKNGCTLLTHWSGGPVDFCPVSGE